MNIYDIAKKAGVSTATVSRVINGNGKVSQKSKIKIEKIMEQEGYIPNVFARGLNLNSIKTVGILCPVIADINHARQVAIVERLLREKGFDSLLCCTGSNEEDKSTYLDLLLNKRVDAIVVIGSTIKESKNFTHFENTAKKVPIIIINGLIQLDNIYCILCDEENAIYEMVKTLYNRKIKDIVYLYDTETYSGYQKLAGYKKGLAACGIEENPNLLIKTGDNISGFDSSYEVMRRLVDSKIKFSAVLSADDILAIGAMKALQYEKIEIPIIGFNNTNYCKCTTPSLTSFDNMVGSICTSAINVLMDVLDGKDSANKIVISPKLIERETFQL